MPERAAEAMQAMQAMQAPDDTRDELIAKAAAELSASPDEGPSSKHLRDSVGAVGGSTPEGITVFLAAYYRRVAVEDLMAAGPARLAATAARHAALGAGRPQGDRKSVV